jgi:hypothetical protein
LSRRPPRVVSAVPRKPDIYTQRRRRLQVRLSRTRSVTLAGPRIRAGIHDHAEASGGHGLDVVTVPTTGSHGRNRSDARPTTRPPKWRRDGGPAAKRRSQTVPPAGFEPAHPPPEAGRFTDQGRHEQATQSRWTSPLSLPPPGDPSSSHEPLHAVAGKGSGGSRATSLGSWRSSGGSRWARTTSSRGPGPRLGDLVERVWVR